MGITAFPFTSVIDVPTARILGRDDAGTGSAEALTNTEIFAILGTGTPSASTYLRGDGTWSTVSAGVGGSTGSTDNAVLRADGTGGATLQNSSIVIPDNFTASPNATVNHASIQATGATTNVSVSIVPKGTGAFSLHVPDGTATGGNVRGANAIDLQTARTAATQVASGGGSAVLAGQRNSATGSRGATAGGFESVASGTYEAFAWGERATASGFEGSWATGTSCTSSASYAHARGRSAVADRQGMQAEANGAFAALGDAQHVRFVARNKTTTNAAVTLFLDGSSARLTIPSGKILCATVQILGSKSDGTAVASYIRQVAIKNVGGTTSLVGTVNTIGTDEAAGTSVAITADDTNDALQIAPTGVLNETWRWVAVVYGAELAYGT